MYQVKNQRGRYFPGKKKRVLKTSGNIGRRDQDLFHGSPQGRTSKKRDGECVISFLELL